MTKPTVAPQLHPRQMAVTDKYLSHFTWAEFVRMLVRCGCSCIAYSEYSSPSLLNGTMNGFSTRLHQRDRFIKLGVVIVRPGMLSLLLLLQHG